MLIKMFSESNYDIKINEVKGAGGVFIKILSKLTLELFLIEGSDIYQMLLIPWKNIVPSRNYCWPKVSAYV